MNPTNWFCRNGVSAIPNIKFSVSGLHKICRCNVCRVHHIKLLKDHIIREQRPFQFLNSSKTSLFICSCQHSQFNVDLVEQQSISDILMSTAENGSILFPSFQSCIFQTTLDQMAQIPQRLKVEDEKPPTQHLRQKIKYLFCSKMKKIIIIVLI